MSANSPATASKTDDDFATLSDSELVQLICQGNFETHIDHCEACAEAVLIVRRHHSLAPPNVMPPPNADERKREKDRLRRLLQPGVQAGIERQNPNSPDSINEGDEPDSTVWISLGAMGGVITLGSAGFGPKPTRAGSEGSVQHAGTSPHKAGDGTEGSANHDSTRHENSENSVHSPVTSADELPSTNQNHAEPRHDHDDGNGLSDHTLDGFHR